MKTKEFIKLFIPPIVLKARSKIRQLGIKGDEFISTISQFEKKSDTLCILGNGPSLTQSIEKYADFIKSHDCVVVNYFCETDYFEILKPKIYVFADPALFYSWKELSEYFRNKVEKFLLTLKNKLSWHIVFVVPDVAVGSFFVEELKNNKFVTFLFYNASKTKSNISDLEKFQLWDKNLIPPPAQTVINVCIYLGIFWKYSNINVFGMDMTWHEDLEVDQKTNVLYIQDKHFYGNERVPVILDPRGKRNAKLHEYLQCAVNVFRECWSLREYADYQNIKITNCSPYSFVDAFERSSGDIL